MTQLLTIQDDKIFIDKLVVTSTEGDVTHSGLFDVIGNTTLHNDLSVYGTISAETINVKNLVTSSGLSSSSGEWTVNTEEELNGKGFTWTYGNGSTRLIYRTGNRLWCNSDIDLDSESSYKIDNVPVISASSLGSQIKYSKLTQVGNLLSLTVLGDTNVGEFAFFNTTHNRLGLGTSEPNSSISIVDNNVEISIGSPKYGLANIGTYSNHDVAIITDNTARILIKNSGEIQIGNENSHNGILKVFGTIQVDNIVSDTRIDRTTSLEFATTRDNGIYGKGIIWTGTGNTRQLVMMGEPDRIWSSESFDIAADKSYLINGSPVLTSSSLGYSITESHLTSVGILESLTISGPATASLITANELIAETVHISTGITANESISLSINTSEVFYADSSQIVIGSSENQRSTVKIHGALSVGINNPDPTVGLSVRGDVSFANKKFVTNTSIPQGGTFVIGDICWNQSPVADGYVGWICIVDGTPGEWLPFGSIARQ
jgi:hypothetical protein